MLNNDEAPPQQQQQQWIFTRDELDACGLLEPENRSSMASFVQVLGKHIHLYVSFFTCSLNLIGLR